MNSLEGKSILVSAGGSGIGRAGALRLAEAGALVTVGDRNGDGAAETAEMIRKRGGKAVSTGADVSAEGEVQAMVGLAVSEFGKLDGLCNAAGIPNLAKLVHELSLAEWQRAIDVNLTGVFLTTKYGVEAILKGGRGGSIVHIASTAAVRGITMTSEYCASKAGVLGFIRGAAHDYGKQGIRINAIMPGPVKTPMLAGSLALIPTLEAKVAEDVPLGRFAEASELGEAIAWLLSDGSSYVTGASIAVDGGHSIA